VDENLCTGILQLRSHINRLRPGLAVDLERVLHVRGHSVEHWSRLHRYIHVRHITDLWRGVGLGEDCFAEIPSNLLLVDFERGYEVDVFDLVGSEAWVHQPGDEAVFFRRILPVVLDALYQRACTVSNPGECDLDRSHLRYVPRPPPTPSYYNPRSPYVVPGLFCILVICQYDLLLFRVCSLI